MENNGPVIWTDYHCYKWSISDTVSDSRQPLRLQDGGSSSPLHPPVVPRHMRKRSAAALRGHSRREERSFQVVLEFKIYRFREILEMRMSGRDRTVR